MKRLLLLSCHEVLERDELLLLRELGYYVFSPGSFVNPDNRGDHLLRPGLAGLAYDESDVAGWHALGRAGLDNKLCLSKEYVDRFDGVIIHHIPDWVTVNWESGALGAKPVILRTIGQLIEPQELKLGPYRLKGLKVVRYSPAEARIPNYMGEDAMIRFYKDPEEWTGWTGENELILHVGQDVIKRALACSYDFYEKITRPYPRKLIGSGSEVVPWGTGRVEFPVLVDEMRKARMLFYTGTHPASYTLNFIEAWMMGLPIVSVGRLHGNSLDIPNHKLFEVPDLLTGTNGFASDDPFELRDYILELFRNKAFASSVSMHGRNSAIATFGKETIKAQWKSFLDGVL